MSKYKPLSDRLAVHPAEEWRASFSELESVLGFPLPKAARSSRAWWAKNHGRAWVGEGWVLGDVDQAGEVAVFRREVPVSAPAVVQPPVMDEASETASAATRASRALGVTAMVTAGVAVVAGLGALLVRGVLRRR
jgi:hypothetical protein